MFIRVAVLGIYFLYRIEYIKSGDYLASLTMLEQTV